MRVLIIAMGRSRRPAVLGEALAACAAGDEVTLYVGEPGAWTAPAAAAGAAVCTQRELLWREHWPQWVAHLLVWRLPLLLLRGRAAAAYRERVAPRVQRTLVDRVHRRIWPRAAAAALARHVAARWYDAVVPADPPAILLAGRSGLVDHARRSAVQVAYSVDHLTPCGTAATGMV
ncbi:MAG TPA: hypothetical protein VFY17_01885 [Pilimelia sp.]|nr:hypothetical protein [Pilimelia sp.]